MISMDRDDVFICDLVTKQRPDYVSGFFPSFKSHLILVIKWMMSEALEHGFLRCKNVSLA